MKKFTANTLDAALIEATKYFNCSLTQIEYEVLQNPSGGIFGFLKKEAIIIATKKQNTQPEQTTLNNQNINSILLQGLSNNVLHTTQQKDIQTISSEVANNIDSISENENAKINMKDEHDYKSATHKQALDEDKNSCSSTKDTDTIKQSDIAINDNIENTYTKQDEYETTISKTLESNVLDSNIDSNAGTKNLENFSDDYSIDEKLQSNFDSTFYNKDSNIPWQNNSRRNIQQTQDIESVCTKVQEELTELLQFLPLELNKIKVEPHDDHTLFILIDGLDAALLIGQKGYRYKSLSYLLFNWVNSCYGYGVRLEIAQFLKNQEEIMRTYLEPIIETAKLQGKAQTKPLDGVLTHIALKMLRDALPNKYIVFRENADGEKYISISEFVYSGNVRNSVNGFGNSPKY